MKVGKTGRGFQIVEFNDIYGAPCSLQQSSLAQYQQPGSSAVWFGPDDACPKRLVPGQSWQPVPFPPDTSFNTRAHLDRKQVSKLVSYLQTWLDCGYFVRPRPKRAEVAKPTHNRRSTKAGRV